MIVRKNHKSFIKSIKNKFPNNLSRSIDTWYFDHLINPFAHIDWQIDSLNLIDYANKFGLIFIHLIQIILIIMKLLGINRQG